MIKNFELCTDIRQNHFHVHSYAKLDWRFWWWARAVLSHCDKLRHSFESCHEWGRRKPRLIRSQSDVRFFRSTLILYVNTNLNRWHWLGRMKQPNGGFSVCQGGEIDIRGAYCSMTIISLLNLPLELPPDSPARINGNETFLTNLEDWISRCQTYEGGMAGAPNSEAHGAYAFCALACLAIIDDPAKNVPR